MAYLKTRRLNRIQLISIPFTCFMLVAGPAAAGNVEFTIDASQSTVTLELVDNFGVAIDYDSSFVSGSLTLSLGNPTGTAPGRDWNVSAALVGANVVATSTLFVGDTFFGAEATTVELLDFNEKPIGFGIVSGSSAPDLPTTTLTGGPSISTGSVGTEILLHVAGTLANSGILTPVDDTTWIPQTVLQYWNLTVADDNLLGAIGSGDTEFRLTGSLWLSPDALRLVFDIVAQANYSACDQPSAGNLVANSGFELDESLSSPGGGLPVAFGDWKGDQAGLAYPERGIDGLLIAPHAGCRMLRFDSTTDSGPGVATASQQFQLIDLSSVAAQVDDGFVEVSGSAWFNRGSLVNSDTRFNIEILAYQGTPDTYPVQQFNSSHLASSSTALYTDADPATWEQATTGFQIPVDADFLAVHIYALENILNESVAPEFFGHYADSIEVDLIISPIVPVLSLPATLVLLLALAAVARIDRVPRRWR